MSQSARSDDNFEPIADSDPLNACGREAPREAIAPNTEIELKLLCDPKYLVKIANAPLVAHYACDEGETIDLTAIYYDTPDLDLRKAGYTLRVRTGGSHFVMTFKARRDRQSS